MAELGGEFPKVEIKGYDNKTLRKKANPWEEMLQKFNSRNPNGIKRDMNMSFYLFFFFLRGHGNESCNLIGSLPGQYFPISAHGPR